MITISKDIIVGKALIPFSEDVVMPKDGPQAGRTLQPGWVLPGGERTTNHRYALEVAEQMARMMMGLK